MGPVLGGVGSLKAEVGERRAEPPSTIPALEDEGSRTEVITKTTSRQKCMYVRVCVCVPLNIANKSRHSQDLLVSWKKGSFTYVNDYAFFSMSKLQWSRAMPTCSYRGRKVVFQIVAVRHERYRSVAEKLSHQNHHTSWVPGPQRKTCESVNRFCLVGYSV